MREEEGDMEPLDLVGVVESLEEKGVLDASEITTKGGLLYRDGRVIPLPDADLVARQHGHQYAETYVRYLELKGRIEPDGSAGDRL